MKRGDIVYCLNPGSYPLTAGETYQVLLCEGDWLLVIGDSGFEGRYSSARFKPLEDLPQEVAREAA